MLHYMVYVTFHPKAVMLQTQGLMYLGLFFGVDPTPWYDAYV